VKAKVVEASYVREEDTRFKTTSSDERFKVPVVTRLRQKQNIMRMMKG